MNSLITLDLFSNNSSFEISLFQLTFEPEYVLLKAIPIFLKFSSLKVTLNVLFVQLINR